MKQQRFNGDHLSNYDFDLPEKLIALRPSSPRSSSRLLVSSRNGIQDDVFANLVDHLRAGDRLILNNTKVRAARLQGQRRRISDNGASFAKVEVTLLSLNTEGNWLTLVKPARRLAEGETIVFDADLSAVVLRKSSDGVLLQFNQRGDTFDTTINQIGMMPLPPYIAGKRAADLKDNQDYQTVFASKLGAVAAPTASLHFDEQLLSAIKAKGVDISKVTLHVGAGTFLPVKTDDISQHKMHSEWGQVSAQTANEINQTKKAGGRVIPVGTTALRLIETAAQSGEITEWVGDTDIFIRPDFEFAVTDGLITNFHLPKSTLLMLVSALIGPAAIQSVYEHAISENYRFFSYGDGSLLLP